MFCERGVEEDRRGKRGERFAKEGEFEVIRKKEEEGRKQTVSPV